MSLGETLKQARKTQHRSQQQAAADLCSQSMLSAIENDRYTPNARLLVGLCDRLNINISNLSLASDFDISFNPDINQTMQRLCNAHQYHELDHFLQQVTVRQQIRTNEQTQAYYYYLGIAQYQAGHQLDAAKQNLQLAVNCSLTRMMTTLTRLSQSSLAVIYAHQQIPRKARHLLDEAIQDIDQLSYDENLNIPFYLAAFTEYQLKAYDSATSWLVQGINFTTSHQSHYMLANDYRLLAEIALKQDQASQYLDALTKQRFLTELFHEAVNENF